MGDFITGVLAENKDGATYEGYVYDRFLKLRLSDGQLLTIFDPPGPYGPVSTGIAIGEIYEMILITVPSPKSIQYFAVGKPALSTGIWQGTVVEPHWKLAKGEEHMRIHQHFCNREWVLLRTLRGDLLMSPKEINAPARKGGIVQWENLRLDLCAII